MRSPLSPIVNLRLFVDVHYFLATALVIVSQQLEIRAEGLSQLPCNGQSSIDVNIVQVRFHVFQHTRADRYDVTMSSK